MYTHLNVTAMEADNYVDYKLVVICVQVLFCCCWRLTMHEIRYVYEQHFKSYNEKVRK